MLLDSFIDVIKFVKNAIITALYASVLICIGFFFFPVIAILIGVEKTFRALMNINTKDAFCLKILDGFFNLQKPITKFLGIFDFIKDIFLDTTSNNTDNIAQVINDENGMYINISATNDEIKLFRDTNIAKVEHISKKELDNFVSNFNFNIEDKNEIEEFKDFLRNIYQSNELSKKSVEVIRRAIKGNIYNSYVDRKYNTKSVFNQIVEDLFMSFYWEINDMENIHPSIIKDELSIRRLFFHLKKDKLNSLVNKLDKEDECLLTKLDLTSEENERKDKLLEIKYKNLRELTRDSYLNDYKDVIQKFNDYYLQQDTTKEPKEYIKQYLEEYKEEEYQKYLEKDITKVVHIGYFDDQVKERVGKYSTSNLSTSQLLLSSSNQSVDDSSFIPADTAERQKIHRRSKSFELNNRVL